MELYQLPDSVLLQIFQYVAYDSLCLGVRLTCRRFSVLTKDPSLWKLVEIPHHFTDERFILLLDQIHIYVEGLECSQCENLTVKAMEMLGSLEFPKLKHLAVPISQGFPDYVYEKLSLMCPILEELENVSANEEETCQPIICQSLFKQLKVVHDKPVSTYGRIRKVILRPSVEEDNIKKLSLWQHNLMILSQNCPNITSYHCRRGLDYIDDSRIIEIAKLFPNLKELELHSCVVGNDGIVAFFAHLTGKLHTLKLESTDNITDAALLKIVQSLTELKKVKIARCSKITNEGIKCILSNCPKLQDITINNNTRNRSCEYTDETVIHLAECCPDLISLSIFHSSAISGKSIAKVQQKCRALRGLLLYECPNIGDDALECIKNMKYLRSLVLMHCNQITPTGIMNLILKSEYLHRFTLFSKNRTLYGDMSKLGQDIYSMIDDPQHSFLPNVVKVLNLKGIGGQLVQLMTVLCPNLHTLDIREEVPISIPTLETLLKNCESLQILDVSHMVKLDDSIVKSLRSYGQNIKKICFGNEFLNLSQQGINELVSECVSLKTVCIDQNEAKLDEDYLVSVTKENHGGNCFLHEDKSCPLLSAEEEKDPGRYIELYFTPKKYLKSVPGNIDECNV